MNWFASIIGGTVGFLLAGPLGAIAGGVLGNALSGNRREAPAYEDQNAEHFLGRMQATYFVSLFTLLGKIARADGVVHESEGKLVLRFINEMQLRGQVRQFAIDLFNTAQSSQFSIQDLARQFRQISEHRRELRLSIVDMLYNIAMADGELHPKEEESIATVVTILGISDAEVEHVRQRHGAGAHRAYHILGVSPTATNDELHAAYRKLAKEYHPDRVLARGMPDEFINFADRRFREIQNAWETVQKERGLS